MALTLVATPGAANANSYPTLEEATAYFEGRSTVQEWEDADSKEALLVMATRAIDMLLAPGGRTLISGASPYFRVRPHWTGAPATAAQALAWPRIGMTNRNGFPIAENIVPQELKDAVSEFAGQLSKADRTLDNSVAVQGITSVKAGSVAVTFKNDGILTTKVIPDAVLFLLVPSWMTDEVIEGAYSAQFEVMP